jgi:hypothetical protein
MNVRRSMAAALTLAGALAGGAAQAHGGGVSWSIRIGVPIVSAPYPHYPVARHGGYVVVPAPVVRYRHYRPVARWDVDGDGIPNRHDRRYNPRWDRDGDGIPNRYDRRPHDPRW